MTMCDKEQYIKDLKLVKENGYNLWHVVNQTDQIC